MDLRETEELKELRSRDRERDLALADQMQDVISPYFDILNNPNSTEEGRDSARRLINTYFRSELWAEKQRGYLFARQFEKT